MVYLTRLILFVKQELKQDKIYIFEYFVIVLSRFVCDR